MVLSLTTLEPHAGIIDSVSYYYAYYNTGIRQYDNISFQKWTFSKAEIAGIFIRNKNTKKLYKHFTQTINIKDGSVRTLDSMNLEVVPCSSNGVNEYELNVTWSSLDTTVATVNSLGTVTLHKEGEAVITARATIDNIAYSTSYVLVVQRKAIIIIPGFMGSELVAGAESDSPGEELWTRDVIAGFEKLPTDGLAAINTQSIICDHLEKLICDLEGTSVEDVDVLKDG